MDIGANVLFRLLTGDGDDNYVIIEDNITSSDSEDGGADHEFVVQEKSTGNFYKGYYTDWDIDNTDYDDENDEIGERCDLDSELHQVYPKQITMTIYE